MRKTMIFIGLIGMLGAGLATSQKESTENLYADCGVILEDPGENVTITMQDGNRFSFENVDGDWMTGDIVSVIFDSKGTAKVFDDEIIDYRYSGWISDEEMENWIK